MFAEDWVQSAKLTASDGAENDHFGISVALSGDTALVGAERDDDHGIFSGSAYVFEKVNGQWTQTAKLTASDGEMSDRFGSSVALAGDSALVGAILGDGHEQNSGSAYVFEKVNGVWTESAKLIAADGEYLDEFGRSVALSGDTAVVGAWRSDGRGLNWGSVYVFEKVDGEWTQSAKLTAADGAPGDYFGHSVALSGGSALFGAHGDDDRGTNSGSAYVFEKVDREWTEAAKLTAADGDTNDHFGWSVALTEGILVVGAPDETNIADRSGSAYVFKKVDDAWTQDAKLTAPDGAAIDLFGFSVALSGHTALIGAYLDDDRGPNSGSAYVFEKVNGVWTEAAKLTAEDGAATDEFGYSVALSGDAGLIGAWLDDNGWRNSGSAYVFERAGGCTGNERIAKANCAGGHGRGQLRVQLAGGVPDDAFTIILSTGPVKQGTLNSRGKGKVKFKRLPSGPGTAIATWGCGVEKQKNYSCP